MALTGGITDRLLRDNKKFFEGWLPAPVDRCCIDEFVSLLRPLVTEQRLIHSVSVTLTALKILQFYRIDCEPSHVLEAAMLHDCAKELPLDRQIVLAGQIADDSEWKYAPQVLLHGPAGAALAGRDFNVHDRDVIEAIRYHVTGKQKASELLKILMVADFTEPQRRFSCKELQCCSFRTLDKFVTEVVIRKIHWVTSRHQVLSPLSVDMFNELVTSTTET